MKKIISLILALVLLMSCSVSVFAQDLPFIPFGDTVEINGLNLVLDGEIGLVYHIKVPSAYTDGYAVLSCKGDDEPMQVNIADCPTDTQGRYMITYDLSSIQLSEPVTVTVYDKNGVQLATKAKSAEEYAAIMIADKDSTEKEIAVAKALISYGHYAQLACSEYCGWTIGEDYAETTAYSAPTVTKEVFDDYKIKWEGTGICSVAFQLRLDYKTDFIIYLPSSEQEPTVTVNGETTDDIEKCEDGRYKLYIRGINVMHLADTYEISVNDTLKFTASAFSYGYLAMNGKSENTKLSLLSMYEFYKATLDYNE